MSLILYLVWLIKFKGKKTKHVGAEFISALGGDPPPLAGDFAKLNKLHPYILVYHKVDDSFEWGITRQKTRQFENQMKYLFENGYKSISLEDAFLQQLAEDSATRNKTVGARCTVPLPKKDLPSSNPPDTEPIVTDKRVVITFDDGYESVYKFTFPILQKYGFVASVFVITGYVGKFNDWDVTWGKRFRHLSWEQIQELAKYGFTFGSHTVNHPDLTKLDSKSLEYELSYSKRTLEDKIGKRVVFLSYPFGKYNTKVQEMAKKTGYERAYTIFASGGSHQEPGDSFSDDQIVGAYCNTPLLDLNPFALERIGMYLLDSALTTHIKLNNGRLFWIEDMKGRIINKFSTGTVLAKPKAG